jgi:hypothetical protein
MILLLVSIGDVLAEGIAWSINHAWIELGHEVHPEKDPLN